MYQSENLRKSQERLEGLQQASSQFSKPSTAKPAKFPTQQQTKVTSQAELSRPKPLRVQHSNRTRAVPRTPYSKVVSPQKMSFPSSADARSPLRQKNRPLGPSSNSKQFTPKDPRVPPIAMDLFALADTDCHMPAPAESSVTPDITAQKPQPTSTQPSPQNVATDKRPPRPESPPSYLNVVVPAEQIVPPSTAPSHPGNPPGVEERLAALLSEHDLDMHSLQKENNILSSVVQMQRLLQSAVSPEVKKAASSQALVCVVGVRVDSASSLKNLQFQDKEEPKASPQSKASSEEPPSAVLGPPRSTPSQPPAEPLTSSPLRATDLQPARGPNLVLPSLSNPSASIFGNHLTPMRRREEAVVSRRTLALGASISGKSHLPKAAISSRHTSSPEKQISSRPFTPLQRPNPPVLPAEPLSTPAHPQNDSHSLSVNGLHFGSHCNTKATSIEANLEAHQFLTPKDSRHHEGRNDVRPSADFERARLPQPTPLFASNTPAPLCHTVVAGGPAGRIAPWVAASGTQGPVSTAPVRLSHNRRAPSVNNVKTDVLNQTPKNENENKNLPNVESPEMVSPNTEETSSANPPKPELAPKANPEPLVQNAQAQEDILDDEALLRELDLPTPSNYHDDPEESPVTGMSEQATLLKSGVGHLLLFAQDYIVKHQAESTAQAIEISNLKANIQRLHSEIETVSELSKQQGRDEAFTDSHNQISQMREQFRTETTSWLTERENMVTTHEAKNTALTKQLAEADTDLKSQLESQSDVFEQRVIAAQNRANSAEVQIEKDKLKQRLLAVETELNEAAGRIKHLQTLGDHWKARASRLDRDVESLTARARTKSLSPAPGPVNIQPHTNPVFSPSLSSKHQDLRGSPVPQISASDTMSPHQATSESLLPSDNDLQNLSQTLQASISRMAAFRESLHS